MSCITMLDILIMSHKDNGPHNIIKLSYILGIHPCFFMLTYYGKLFSKIGKFPPHDGEIPRYRKIPQAFTIRLR